MENIKINIKATNLELNDKIRDFVEEKIYSLKKFLNIKESDEALFDVEVGKTTTAQHTGDIFRTEINLSIRGQFYRTESTTDHLFVSVENAIAEMQKQIRRSKNKKTTLFKKGAEKIKNILKGNK
jgi:ribosomal subunit interface protein